MMDEFEVFRARAFGCREADDENVDDDVTDDIDRSRDRRHRRSQRRHGSERANRKAPMTSRDTGSLTAVGDRKGGDHDNGNVESNVSCEGKHY